MNLESGNLATGPEIEMIQDQTFSDRISLTNAA
jgi:hypothetical protein